MRSAALVVFAAAVLIVSTVLGQTFTSPAQAASSTPTLSTLLLAAQTAKLAATDPSKIAPGTLSDPNLVATVFAPSNSAFASYLSSKNLTAAQLLASPALASILEFHVVPDVAAKAANLTSGMELKTLLGPNLTIFLEGSTIIVGGGSNNATVTTPDIVAGKSIVHIIDSVLIPPSAAPAPAPAPTPTVK